MSQDPGQLLFSHFAFYLHEVGIAPKKLELVAQEFQVQDIASNTERFYEAWYWDDDDVPDNTVRFLRRVHEEDPDKAFGVMQRVYDMTGGATEEQLQQYPGVETLEEGDADFPSELLSVSVQLSSFLDLDSVPGNFYPELVDEINTCYRFGIYDGVFVLTRKLLENLLIDILRTKYGTSHIDLYYNTNEKRHRNFSTLVSNFDENLNDFEHISSALDSDFIIELNDFRKTANQEAHAIDVGLSEQDIQDYQETAERCVKVLIRVKENI